MMVKPLGDRVLLKIEKEGGKTKGGLYIPETAQEKTQMGEVIEIGSKAEIEIKTGQRVMYDKYAGSNISIDDVDHLVVKSDDIIAVVS